MLFFFSGLIASANFHDLESKLNDYFHSIISPRHYMKFELSCIPFLDELKKQKVAICTSKDNRQDFSQFMSAIHELNSKKPDFTSFKKHIINISISQKNARYDLTTLVNYTDQLLNFLKPPETPVDELPCNDSLSSQQIFVS